MSKNTKMQFSTPENLKIKNQRHFNRERLNSAPDRLAKNRSELENEANLHRLRVETRQMSDLRLNMKNQTIIECDIPQFKCQVCTKRFHHEEALEAHFLIHSQENLSIHQCEVCHKVCSSKLKLRMHQNKRHPTNSEMLAVF